MNGHPATIYEQGEEPGGLCTAWQRRGFTFDGCLTRLAGVRPGKMLSHLWQALGVLQGASVFIPDVDRVYHAANGKKTLHLYADLPRLEEELHRLAPEDRETIQKLSQAVRSLVAFSEAMEAYDTGGFLAKLRLFRRLRSYLNFVDVWERTSLRELRHRFQNPFLGQSLVRDLGDSAFHFLLQLAWMAQRNAGLPAGGSRALARSMEQRFLALGGDIQYGQRVESVLIENGRAVGIQLTGGEETRGDGVISAADGHATLFDLLQGRTLDRDHEFAYRRWATSPGTVQISLGLAFDLQDQPVEQTWELPRPMILGDDRMGELTFRHFTHDPGFAPPGRCVAHVRFDSDIRSWRSLRVNDESTYRDRKERIAQAVIDLLEERLPGLRQGIEEIDVTTPVTTADATGNWNGATHGWLPAPGTSPFSGPKVLPQTLPGLRSFWLAGQWSSPGGGVATVAQGGRRLIQRFCQEGKRPFQARR